MRQTLIKIIIVLIAIGGVVFSVAYFLGQEFRSTEGVSVAQPSSITPSVRDNPPLHLTKAATGTTATFSSLGLDRVAYKKGDTAQAIVRWSPSFADRESDESTISEEQMTVSLMVQDGQGNVCSDPVTVVVGKRLALASLVAHNMSVVIIADCPAAVAVASVSDKDGTLLASAKSVSSVGGATQ